MNVLYHEYLIIGSTKILTNKYLRDAPDKTRKVYIFHFYHISPFFHTVES